MTQRILLFAAACCLAACSNISPGGAAEGDPCSLSTDCESPYACINGRCEPGITAVCTSGTLSCNGNDLIVCNTGGTGYTVQQTCTYGCLQGACQEPTCTGGDQRCVDNSIEQCLPDGTAWVAIQVCPTTCLSQPSGSNANLNTAQCTEPVCSPFSTECQAADPSSVYTCNSTGTSYTSSACSTDPSNPATCVSGECEPVICTAGTQEQCDGLIAQQCNSTGTGWDTLQVCGTACSVDNSGTASCLPQICTPFSTQCDADGVTLQTCNDLGTAWMNSICTVPGGSAVCTQNAAGAQCAAKVCSNTSNGDAGVTQALQCNGGTLQICAPDQASWETDATCPYGCNPTGGSGGVAACITTPPCTYNSNSGVGEGKCTGDFLYECLPDQSGYAFVQTCPSGCTVDNSTNPPTGSCLPPSCVPLSQSCGTDPATGDPAVFLCSASGASTQEIETCSQTCVGGECIVDNANCNPGDLRCNGLDVQECDLQNATGTTQWDLVEDCLGSCSEGACGSGGACGCPTGTASCGGSTGTPVVTVNAMLPADTTVPCQDGTATSKVLIYTNPITDPSGNLVPDGTLVTFTNDFPPSTPDSLIVSANAGTGSAVQRPTFQGVAEAVLEAPSQTNCGSNGSRTVTVTATVGSDCNGSVAVNFARLTEPPREIFFAEDFSSATDESFAQTTATWDTTDGAIEAIPDYSLGTGADGALTVGTVSSPVTLDLQASGYAPEWDVVSFTSQTATVTLGTGSQVTLAAGDEVLISTVWGISGATSPGDYEFKTVQSVSGQTITFTTPITQIFGNSDANVDLTNLRVVVQRVPQFTSVTINTGSVLTSTALGKGTCSSSCTPTGGTGLLAFRVQNTLSVSGGISMDATGLPPNLVSYPNTASTAALNRLLLGPPGTSAGGGVIFIAAQTITFGNTGATIHASTASGGGGGTVWVQGSNLQFGTSPPGEARAIASGVTLPYGRVRLDYATLSEPSSQAMSATESTYVGEAGAVIAQSNVIYSEPTESPQLFFFTAQVLGLLGGSGSVTAAVAPTSIPTSIPGVDLSISSVGGATFPTASADTGTASFPVPGQQIAFQLSLAPPSDQVLSVRGLAFEATAQQ